MEVLDNDGDGTSIFLRPGDSLRDVPSSHEKLVSPTIRAAFVDPLAYFRGIAERCRIRNMREWLEAVLEDGDWELGLHQGNPVEWTEAGFGWWSDAVRSAEIGVPDANHRSTGVAALDDYYSLVDYVRWMDFGRAGSLDGAGGHVPLTNFRYEYHGAPITPDKTFVFGWSPCGDMLVYTSDGRGGWLGHETGKVELLGTVQDTIAWVYGELLANRCPELNDSWAIEAESR